MRFQNKCDSNVSEAATRKIYYRDEISRYSGGLIADFYEDYGSANVYRPEFERMLSDCRAGQIDFIIVRSISGFSRNIIDGLKALNELLALLPPVGVYFENEGLFLLNPSDALSLNMIFECAKWESEHKELNCLCRANQTYIRRRSNGE
ncbi:hypothetical protein FACS189490_07150 [Clostridia bacterium]|nr:hypothetical protein FACS189490_07150 [Clostridia bacterium]